MNRLQEALALLGYENHSPGAGVFTSHIDPAHFAQVFVEHGAVTGPGEIDLAPDAMYAEIKKACKWVLQ